MPITAQDSSKINAIVTSPVIEAIKAYTPPGAAGIAVKVFIQLPGAIYDGTINMHQRPEGGYQAVLTSTGEVVEALLVAEVLSASLTVMVESAVVAAGLTISAPVIAIGAGFGVAIAMAGTWDTVRPMLHDGVSNAVMLAGEVFSDIDNTQFHIFNVDESATKEQITLYNTNGQTSLDYSINPANPSLAITEQDIIDAIIPIKQSPIPNNPFFVHPEVNITLPSGRSRAYIGTDAAEAFNLIPGSQTAEGGTLVYTLGGDDEIGVNGGNNWIDGGNGTDTVSYSSATPDTQGVPLSVIVGSSGSKNATAIVERTINPEQNTDTLVNVEKIIGTSKDDIFTLTEVVDEMVLDGGEGEDTLKWEGLPGTPSVNVQYGKMQLARRYIDDDFEYYDREYGYFGYMYYSDDFTEQDNPNYVSLHFSNFEQFEGDARYKIGKSYGFPYSYTIQANVPLNVDYRYSDYAIRVDFSSPFIESLDANGNVVAVDTVSPLRTIDGTPYADTFTGTPYKPTDTGERRVSIYAREGDNVYSFLTRDNTHYSIDTAVGGDMRAGDQQIYLDGIQVKGIAQQVTNRLEGSTYTLKQEDNSLLVLTYLDDFNGCDNSGTNSRPLVA